MTEVKSRTVLWYLVFFGFAVNYMIKINLNLTIVEMIATSTAASATQHQGHHPHGMNQSDSEQNHYNQSIDFHNTSGLSGNNAFPHSVSSNLTSAINDSSSRDDHTGRDSKYSKYSIEKHLMEWTNTSYEKRGFHWNEYEQGLILGSFYWAHWITQIPGGILAKKYGTKLIFGLSNAAGCWICFLMPIASYFDYKALIWLRVIQGVVTGLAWPAMHVMTANWIPPNERSKFVTAYLGSSVGIAVFYPLFGYVMHWVSWEWVYHISGIVGSVWWFGWLYFVYDTPAEHPRIQASERNYIEKSLGATVHNRNDLPTPWKAILVSRPVWMNVVAQFGGIWGLFTIMTQAPTYFKVVHHWNIRATGLISGFPHLMRMSFAYVFSIFADHLLKTDKMSRTNLRKLATAVCCILNGMFVFGLAYFGHNSIAAIVLVTAATMVHGAVSSGPLASIVDIAPNYAGIVLGISGMIGVLPGFISSHIVGILTLGNQTFESWRNVFNICGFLLVGSGVLYVLYGDSTLQSWNSPKDTKDVNQKELQLLKESLLEKNMKNLENNKDPTIA